MQIRRRRILQRLSKRWSRQRSRQATLILGASRHLHFRAQREITPLDPDRPYYHALCVRDLDPLSRPSDRTHTWWYTDLEGDALDPLLDRVTGQAHAWCRRTLRPLAVLHHWRTVDPELPASGTACAAALLALGQTLGIRLGVAPGATAFRFFRRFLRAPWPPEPVEIGESAIRRDAGLFLYAARRDTWIRHAFRYDLNEAYASYLRVWPEPGRGEWESTRDLSDTGIYRVRFGGAETWLTGQEIPELSSSDFSRVEFLRGWRFAHDAGPSAFTEFCDFCHAYRGPLRHLVKRFPPIVVGKLRSGWWADRETWYAAACARPTVYAAVVGSLWQRMYRTAKFLGSALTYGFVDGIHSTSELPDHWVGIEPGTWKLEEESPIYYESSVGRWRSVETFRHQGVRV